MIIRICAFSSKGLETADKIKGLLKEHIVELREKSESLDIFVAASFYKRSPLIFVSACGIAVRAIAPFVNDKLYDSPVLVVDELGENVISLLSGHAGGANELARTVADRLGAHPVITTATDINGLFAADVFAVKNGLKIVNRKGIVKVSSAVLEKGAIAVAVDPKIDISDKDMPAEIKLIPFSSADKADMVITCDDCREKKQEDSKLYLVPKELTVGVGCKKNTDEAEIRKAVDESLALLEGEWGWDDIRAMASIDLKAREYGLVAVAQKNKIPLLTYSSEELQRVEGEFSESEFVKEMTGVSNVCERAAVLSAGEGAELLLNKTLYEGITVAIAKRKAKIEKWKN